MTEASVSFTGNLTDDPEVRYTESGIARAMFRVAVSGRREQEASFFTVIVVRPFFVEECGVDWFPPGARCVGCYSAPAVAWPGVGVRTVSGT